MKLNENYTWKQILEDMDTVSEKINSSPSEDIENSSINTSDEASNKDILEELNNIFTPILVMQGFENDISSKVQESYEAANVLTEKNSLQFDNQTRMAQLISVCAILLQKQKNTKKYQTYAKAAAIRNQMKIEMQKEEYENAKVLAQKYLVNVATSNNSPIARQAANELLPETQH